MMSYRAPRVTRCPINPHPRGPNFFSAAESCFGNGFVCGARPWISIGECIYVLWLNRAQVHALRTFNTRCVYRGERIQMFICILSSGQVWRRCGHRFNYSWPAQSEREIQESDASRISLFQQQQYICMCDACAGPRPLRLIFKCSSLHKTYAVLEGSNVMEQMYQRCMNVHCELLALCEQGFLSLLVANICALITAHQINKLSHRTGISVLREMKVIRRLNSTRHYTAIF